MAAVSGLAAGTPDPNDLEQLRAEMIRMRDDYEKRIAELDARLRALESGGAPEGGAASASGDELADLRAAAREAAGVGAAAPPTVPTGPAMGHERNLSEMNPEISFTGDVLASHSGADSDFDPREFELNLQSALDPFSHGNLTLSITEEGVEIEEGYIDYNGLAPGLSLRAGKMRQTFGVLNRYHLHALPQVDYPLVYQNYFGEDGLAQTGVSVEWLLPRPWSSANELTLQVTDGSAEPFGGDSFKRLAALLHVKNFWDVTPATWVEWGLSGIAGSAADGRDTRVLGSDFTVHWQPPGRAKYRELTWRTELLNSVRDDSLDARQRAWGGYSYLEGLLRRNLYAGLRYDRYEDALMPGDRFRSIEPYLTWWQSEYVRLRLAYARRTDEMLDESDNDFLIQATWAAGPHKHDSY